MPGRTEELVASAQRLAELLADDGGAEVLAELQRLGRAATRTRSERPAAPAPERVGVWDIERTPDGVALRRVVDDPEERYLWADVDRVPGKAGTRRLVLLGESAARGFLLDPARTPARVLEDCVAGAGITCVDLARTNARAGDIARLVAALPALDADGVVLFAGNNFALPRYSVRHLNTLARALRAGGYRAMREAFWTAVVLPQVRALMSRLADVAREADIPVTVVVPEFNLRDWYPEPVVDVPALPPRELAAWYALCDDSETALRERRWADVVRLTDEMRALDHGMAPRPGWLRGRALEALGDLAGARVAYEQSRDSVCGLLVAATPRVTEPVRELLVSSADRYGFTVVDLRAVLAGPDGLPDGAYFLDYCHLSPAGVDRAMTAVAAAVAGAACPSRPPTRRESAVTHLLAACHNAYTGQPAATLRRHLAAVTELADESDPGIAELVGALARTLRGRGPLWAQAPWAVLRREPAISRYFTPALRRRVETLGLWRLRECLDALEPDTGAGAEPAVGRVDVLDAVRTGPGRSFRCPNHVDARAYHTATTRTSEFPFALPCASAGRLTIDYRPARAGGSVPVAINGNPVGALPPADGWARHHLPVPAGVTVAGVNRVALTWPTPAEVSEKDSSRMARGEYPFTLPEFGSLFTLSFERSFS